MLRQLHIFFKGELIFSYSYALALGIEELANIKKVIQSYIDMPMPGKTFHRPMSNLQIFHRGAGSVYFLLVADLIDTINYIDKIFKKIQAKFKDLFADPNSVNTPSHSSTDFVQFLTQVQKEMHSKIVIAGPIGSGKTTLYDLLRRGSDQERSIMNFAKATPIAIDDLNFDLWNFQLKENFSLMWAKFIGGSDLVILMFDASKYGLKILSHFLNFEKREAKYSKFLIIANKCDLVGKEELKQIRNELNNIDIIELSLTEPNARARVIQLIRDVLKLKKKLPSNFGELIKKAESFDSQNNITGAIMAYKELINICNQYQEGAYINTFQDKLKELQVKRERQIEQEKELARKSKFSAPEVINFGNKLSVKTLPSVKSLPTVAPPVKATNLKPVSVPVAVNQKQESKKLSLGIGDFKIKIPNSIKDSQEVLTPPIQEPKSQGSIRPVRFIPYDKNLSDNIASDGSYNFATVLSEIIKNNGSTLSQKLCGRYIEEMLDAMQRPLTIEDLNLAAELFIKIENEG